MVASILLRNSVFYFLCIILRLRQYLLIHKLIYSLLICEIMRSYIHFRRTHIFWLPLFFLLGIQIMFFIPAESQDVFDPPALYATWIDDPTSTMTIIWHSEDKNGGNNRDKYTHFEYRLKNKRLKFR